MPGGRPSRIEYSNAFDYAACWLGEAESQLLVVTSAAEFVDLALARATEGVAFICEDNATSSLQGCAFSRVLWASPRPTSWRSTLAALSSPQSAARVLCILSGTTWGRFIRPLRAQTQSSEPANLARQMRDALAVHGWTITRRRALGGVAAVGWAAVTRFTARLGRADLADRAEHAHRRASETTLGASYELLLAIRS
jgi:hypothetical protein